MTRVQDDAAGVARIRGPARYRCFVTSIEKSEVRRLLVERVAQSLETLEESQQTIQAGATHEESRAEDPKDTRATESSYLARGLAERVAKLRNGMARLEALELRVFAAADEIALSALIGLENEKGQKSVSFLVPAGGGENLQVEGIPVRCVTPGSPLGAALLGRELGDEIELDLPGGRSVFLVVWIR